MTHRATKAWPGLCLMLTAGCFQDGSGSSDLAPHPLSIDEPIVLASTEVLPARPVGDHEWEVDLSSPGIDAFNEIEILYETASPCDEDGWLLHAGSGRWHAFSFRNRTPGLLCWMMVTPQAQTIRDLAYTARDYVSGQGVLRVRTYGLHVDGVRLFRLDEAYSAVRPLDALGSNAFDGIAYDGEVYWLSSNLTDRIHRVSLAGKVLGSFDPGYRYLQDLAFDGTKLWLSDGSDRIAALSTWGSRLGDFTVPTDFPGGLAWGAGSLWLSEYEGPDLRLFRIDPVASLREGSAVILDAWRLPGGGARGLAWDGEHVVAATDALYLIAPDGSVAASFELPVARVGGLAWADGALAMICRGPLGIGGSDLKIARFSLPDAGP